MEKDLTITDEAKVQLDVLMGEANLSGDSYLRVAVIGGGCSGLSYDLSFTNEIDVKSGDNTYEENGVKVVINIKTLMYLMGTTIDYTSGLNGKGFEFINPNASRSCGCGESFSV